MALAAKKILLVDDERSVRDSLSEILSAQNFAVQTAADGLDALDLLRTFEPDLVLLDILMPRLDGIETLKRLKSQYPKLPVIIASGAGQISSAGQALEIGADGFIRKPFSGDQLQQSILAILDSNGLAKNEAKDCSLNRIFNPSSIAVIGASETSGKAGERRTRSILESGFSGALYPVNPKRATVFSIPCSPSVVDIPCESIDLALIAVAPEHIPAAVEQCCEKKTKGVIVVTAGKDDGSDTNNSLDDRLRSIIRGTDTRIIGPNCSGLFNSAAQLNCLGIPGIGKGPLAIVSQSGNVIDSLIHYADSAYTGFSKIVGIGNAIDLQFHDYLEYLSEDPETKVIMCYIEGITEGEAFVEAARKAVVNKPVIAIKVGNTDAGKRAAASHTDSLVGDSAVVDAALEQAGVLRADNPDEMFAVACCLGFCPTPKGNRVAILSEGGGHNAMAADNATNRKLCVPILSEEFQERIKKHLLPTMPASNPIDYGGTAEENPEVITNCVRECLASDEVDSVYITGFFGGFKTFISERVGELEETAAKELVALVNEFQKPLIVHSSFAESKVETLEILKRAGIPVFESSHRAASGLGQLSCYSASRERISNAQVIESPNKPEQVSKDAFLSARSGGRSNLLETESREILLDYEIPQLPAEFVTSAEQAVAAADQKLGYPLAMKIVSPEIVHKSDAGGIMLNLSSATEVSSAYAEIVRSAENHTSREQILGALISPMCEKGIECIIGMTRDPVFGPVLMFGLGGIFVEVIKDFSIRVLPLYQQDIGEMLDEIAGAAVLKGIRGRPGGDLEALRKLIEKVCLIVQDNPEISELDLNPVVVHEEGITVLDSRVILGVETSTRIA